VLTHTFICFASLHKLKIGLPITEVQALFANVLEESRDNRLPKKPCRSDGSAYTLDNLEDDQKRAMALVLSAVRSYIKGTKMNEENILRLTVSGVAGSGKSTWINTLASTLREIFPNYDSVVVCAPTGSAAYNAGGETIHRGFGIPVTNSQNHNLTPGKTQQLLAKFRTMMVIIIDERSMVDATTLGLMEKNMRECAHGGVKQHLPWGGIPVIIMVGDDYQLPSINPGAFYARAKDQHVGNAKRASATMQQLGFEEFEKMGKQVVYLKGEKRVNADQDDFKRILRAVRCEDESTQMTTPDTNRLLELHLSHTSFSTEQRRAIRSEAMYIFANREPRDELNARMLKLLNDTGIPVAKISSKTINSHGKIVNNNAHFNQDRHPAKILICRDARVSLNGINPSPKDGLYHGSLGVVRDIVYAEGTSPRTRDFPLYVLVEFFQYTGKEMVNGKPKYIPVTPQNIRCNFKCCVRTVMPLTLAYGKTAHTFQGQNVGPLPNNRPPNPIQKIIVDPGKRTFEGVNVGLFYQCLSRATTIGKQSDKMSSAIYFDGKNFDRERFQNLTMSKGKGMYKKAVLRKNWVNYLNENVVPTNNWTKDKIEEVFTWATTTTIQNLKDIIDGTL
jgi:PIF1-like helicase